MSQIRDNIIAQLTQAGDDKIINMINAVDTSPDRGARAEILQALEGRITEQEFNELKTDIYAKYHEFKSKLEQAEIHEVKKPSSLRAAFTPEEQTIYKSAELAFNSNDPYGYTCNVLPLIEEYEDSFKDKIRLNLQKNYASKQKELKEFFASVKEMEKKEYLKNTIGTSDTSSIVKMVEIFTKTHNVKIDDNGMVSTSYPFYIMSEKLKHSDLLRMEQVNDAKLSDLREERQQNASTFIAMEIRRHLDIQGIRIKDSFNSFAEEQERHLISDLKQRIREKIKFSEESLEIVEKAKAWERFIDMCFEPGSPEVRDVYIAVLKRFIYNVKCKLHNTYTDLNVPMMPIFYGQLQHTGKSVLMNRFCSPIGQYFIGSSNTSEITSDKNHSLFEKNFIVKLDEMARLDKVDMNSLKERLTSTYFNGRLMRENSDRKIFIKCMYIGTSNDPVRNIWKDPTGNRRIFEMKFTSNRNFQERNDFMNEFLEHLWKSVDHRATDPAKPYADRIEALQGDAMAENPYVEFIVEQITLHQKLNKGSESWDFVLSKDFGTSYQNYGEGKWGRMGTRPSNKVMDDAFQNSSFVMQLRKEGYEFTRTNKSNKITYEFRKIDEK
ncbi:hypothetical protein D3W54_16010 (plasmid) [Komagataeibacter medellinensis]|uniref:Virulence-associated protein E-like domain-containing protein n=1 Tax=Komagataeibacter medellinensis TaxID=1177712 RepID=A0ABQ6VQQ7_9PROT|nr:VapE domain-containing protein [Komagataeibacter medellinensis]KAB8122213.1 hypothetical protein D3W54_16010 [Komagataeibacter medellinensis]